MIETPVVVTPPTGNFGGVTGWYQSIGYSKKYYPNNTTIANIYKIINKNEINRNII